MIAGIPLPFVPNASCDAVRKLRLHLGTDKTAVRVRVVTGPDVRERNCFVNVRDRVEREGGRMQLGWAVWQHSCLFIEAEPHAVFDPGSGKLWVDCTPHILPDGRPCREILFIPNDEACYDFDTTETPDNVRVALVDDPGVLEALKLLSEKTALINSVPGIDVPLPTDVQDKIAKLGRQALILLVGAMRPSTAGGLRQGVGRNDPCPCSSGKKFKKCHGL